MTTKQEYLQQTCVRDVIDALTAILPRWKINYDSRFRRLRDRKFEAVGVENVLASYAWPAKFRAPRSLSVGNHAYNAGEIVESYDWASTQLVLEGLGSALRHSIEEGDNEGVIEWASCILDWGMGARGAPAKLFLGSLKERGVAQYLRTVDEAVCSADLRNITEEVVPVVGAGMSKIYSLASRSNLIIFDSRVALALGTAINVFLVDQGYRTIPPELALGRTPERTPAETVCGWNQPVLNRDWRWLNAQVRASWLLEAVLLKAHTVFNGALRTRVHCLEAALFMIGTQPKPVLRGLRSSIMAPM